jgi:hypothetical protein
METIAPQKSSFFCARRIDYRLCSIDYRFRLTGGRPAQLTESVPAYAPSSS